MCVEHLCMSKWKSSWRYWTWAWFTGQCVVRFGEEQSYRSLLPRRSCGDWWHFSGYSGEHCIPSCSHGNNFPVTSCTNRHNLAFLDKELSDRWIGRGMPWLPLSPDLTSLDFFFCGFVKDIVYRGKVPNVNELCDRLIRAVKWVTIEMLSSTWQEIECLGVCCATNDAHVETCWAHREFWKVQCLKMYDFSSALYGWICFIYFHLRQDTVFVVDRYVITWRSF